MNTYARSFDLLACLPVLSKAVSVSLGSRIKELREERGYSQREFGKLAGITGSYVSQIETEYARPSKEVIEAVARALEVPVTELVAAQYPLQPPDFPDKFAAGAKDLTPEEWADMTDYLDMVKRRRQRGPA